MQKTMVLAGLLTALGIMVWPAVDMVILPYACLLSMRVPKFSGLVFENVEEGEGLRALNRILAGKGRRKIVLLVGTESSEFARRFAQSRTCCGFLDMRQIYTMNPIELGCLELLGVGVCIYIYIFVYIYIYICVCVCVFM